MLENPGIPEVRPEILEIPETRCPSSKDYLAPRAFWLNTLRKAIKYGRREVGNATFQSFRV